MTDSTPNEKSTSSGRILRQRRKWLFRGLVFLVGWGAAELFSYVVLQAIADNGIAGVRDTQLRMTEGGVADHNDSETFHPYFGWTHNPDIHTGDIDCCGKKLRTNRFGFFDSTDGIHQRSPDRLIVGICGGSVAWQMSCAAEEVLKQRLREIPEFRNREVIIVRLAQAGYKQPQALFSLTYYLLMGAEFDLILNLDGYNEIALPVAENFRSHAALDYPQGWYVRTRDIVDPRDADFSLRVFELRGQRQRAASQARRSVLRFLPSYQLWWFCQNERKRVEQLDIQAELQKRRESVQSKFIHTGPHPLAKTDEEAIDEAIRIWKQSSLELHRLCQTHGIRYFHATQPNQYDTDSKPLSEYEQRACYSDANDYGKYVITSYPKLRQAGLELQAAGVRQFDLTRIFEKVEETLYVDPFCHVNTRGSELLAEALIDRVSAAIAEPQ